MDESEPHVPFDAAGARVRLGPLSLRRTVVDGGWWPRSADIYAELPDLIRAIDDVHGPVREVTLSAEGWAHHPRHVRIDDRVIRLRFVASQPQSLLGAVCDGGQRIDLLIVAAGESEQTAVAALAMAATEGNRVAAPDIVDAASMIGSPNGAPDAAD